MKKVGRVLGCLLPFLAALACQYAAMMVGSCVLGVIFSFQMVKQGITDIEAQTAYLLEKSTDADILIILTAIATSATLIMGAVWYRKHWQEHDFRLKEVINARLLAAMVCLGVSLQFLVSLCLSVVYPALPQTMMEQYNQLMDTLIGGNAVLSLIVTVILAPVAEELLFRGLTLKKAQKLMPFMAANILQAFLFGVYHLNLIQGVYAFVLGLILGFTAEYFHSIWASIVLHAFVNGSAEILSNLPDSITGTLPGVTGIAVAGVVLLFVAAKLYPKARKEQSQKFSENSFDEQ